MARRTRTSKSFSRGRRRYTWTAALIEIDVNTGATPLQDIIADSSDYSAAGGAATATLIAMRGYVIATPIANSGQVGQSRALIVKTDADDVVGVLDPILIATYVNEHILWTGGYVGRQEAAATAGAVAGASAQRYDINIKAKRKMTTADNIRFVAGQAQGATATSWFGLIRTLFLL